MPRSRACPCHLACPMWSSLIPPGADPRLAWCAWCRERRDDGGHYGGSAPPPSYGGDRPPPREQAWRQGDWECPSCRFHNFASRDRCFKCGEWPAGHAPASILPTCL